MSERGNVLRGAALGGQEPSADGAGALVRPELLVLLWT